MSYKKSCFIRKNTEELRNKLIELGYDYGMSGAAIDKNGDGITLEWFEQANAITTAWLAGTDTTTITNISGVTISDNDYNTVLTKLAQGWTK